MSLTLTLAKRELTALFYSPVAYLVLALFAFVTSLLFIGMFAPGQSAELGYLFGWITWLMVFLVPAISMGLVSEELKSGTIELLMTSPISDGQIIVGKWLGGLAFLGVLLSPLLLFMLILEWAGNPDYGPALSGIIGLLLVGGLYLAIGLFISAFSDSQLGSFLITMLITGFLTIGMYILTTAVNIWDWLRPVLAYVNVNEQFAEFAKGVIDVRRLVFFISGVLLFLFLGVKVLESKRWR